MKTRITKQDWENHIEAQSQSGESIRQYCLGHGLSYHTFRYYKGLCLSAKQTEHPSNSKFLELTDRAEPEQKQTGLALRIHISLGEVFHCEIKLG